MSILISSPLTWSTVAVTAGLLEFGLQLLRLARNDIPPVGDEYEYIGRGKGRHPFTAEPFFRVPLLPAAAWLAGRLGDPARWIRVAAAVSSALAVAATTGAAARVGGVPIAVILTLMLLAIPERFLLGVRIWPDVWLATVTSGIALTLTLTPTVLEPHTAAVLIGLLSAVASLTRLDAVVLVPAVTAVWSAAGLPLQGSVLMWLAGLPATVFAGWWVIAAVLLRQRWPDTTWRFNLGIAAVETAYRRQKTCYTVDDLIVASRRAAAADGNPDPSLWHAHLAAVLARTRAMLGPDTFVRGKLLDPLSGPKPNPRRRILDATLRLTVPLWIAIGAVLIVWAPSPAALLTVPALALAIPAVVFHTRTRYRLPLIYGLVPAAAGAAAQLLAAPSTAVDWLAVVAVGSALGLALSREPRRTERPWAAS